MTVRVPAADLTGAAKYTVDDTVVVESGGAYAQVPAWAVTVLPGSPNAANEATAVADARWYGQDLNDDEGEWAA